MPGVVRSKGFFWLATRPDAVGEISQAGAFARHQGLEPGQRSQKKSGLMMKVSDLI